VKTFFPEITLNHCEKGEDFSEDLFLYILEIIRADSSCLPKLFCSPTATTLSIRV